MVATDTRVAEDNRRIGAVAAFGIAAMPIYFILPRVVGAAFGAQDPTALNLDAQLAMVVAHPNVYGSLGLASMIVGSSFMVLALALHGHLSSTAPLATRVATAAGAIGGALFLVSGFMPMATARTLVRLEAQDHATAVALYVSGPSINESLVTASSILFGAFALFASLVGARAGLLPRALQYVGALLGIAFVVTAALEAVLLLAILLMVIWAAWMGVALLRGQRRGAAAPTAASAVRA